jgi:hypothetical protein
LPLLRRCLTSDTNPAQREQIFEDLRPAPRFYEMVDRKLGERELGAGIVARVCAEAQRAFIVAPPADLEPSTLPSTQPPRSPSRRLA